MPTEQPDLFSPAETLPQGFAYRDDLIGPAEERELVDGFHGLDFRPFMFQGHEGNRRVISFGLHYDFASAMLRDARPIPDFLLALREPAAAFAGIAADRLPHVLVTEYAPGAGIGWHRDRPVFGDVIGVSFVSECRLRFRRRTGAKWQRAAQMLAPRSAYLLRGSARTDWEHSIEPGTTLRYSVTFRTLRHEPPAAAA